MDIGNFYLNTPLVRYEYMRINTTDIPQEVIDEYKLYENNYVINGCVYVEIRQALFRLKNLEHLLINNYPKSWANKGISILNTLLDYGYIKQGKSHLH
jgi:hypothetical protein